MHKGLTLLGCVPYEAVVGPAGAVRWERRGSKEAHRHYTPSIANMTLQRLCLPRRHPRVPCHTPHL